MYDIHMACRMPYTINISIIHIIIQYFFVFNKCSVTNLFKKMMAALRPVNNFFVALWKKRVPIPGIVAINTYVADSPGNSTLLTRSRCLIGLTFNTCTWAYENHLYIISKLSCDKNIFKYKFRMQSNVVV